jgi:hypothetical protein
MTRATHDLGIVQGRGGARSARPSAPRPGARRRGADARAARGMKERPTCPPLPPFASPRKSSAWARASGTGSASAIARTPAPLDPLVELRSRRPDDAENGCPLSRVTRERIFALMPVEIQALLPFGGLLQPEFNRRTSARARYAALSPERRAELAARGAAALKKARLSFRPDLTAAGSSDSLSAQPTPAKNTTNGGETA